MNNFTSKNAIKTSRFMLLCLIIVYLIVLFLKQLLTYFNNKEFCLYIKIIMSTGLILFFVYDLQNQQDGLAWCWYGIENVMCFVWLCRPCEPTKYWHHFTCENKDTRMAFKTSNIMAFKTSNILRVIFIAS